MARQIVDSLPNGFTTSRQIINYMYKSVYIHIRIYTNELDKEKGKEK